MKSFNQSQNHSQELSEENISAIDVESARLFLDVKRPGQMVQNMCIDSTCIICLVKFKAEDVITFSSDVECRHVFHQACITHWIRLKNHCPCCNRTFLNDIHRAKWESAYYWATLIFHVTSFAILLIWIEQPFIARTWFLQ